MGMGEGQWPQSLLLMQKSGSEQLAAGQGPGGCRSELRGDARAPCRLQSSPAPGLPSCLLGSCDPGSTSPSAEATAYRTPLYGQPSWWGEDDGGIPPGDRYQEGPYPGRSRGWSVRPPELGRVVWCCPLWGRQLPAPAELGG